MKSESDAEKEEIVRNEEVKVAAEKFAETEQVTEAEKVVEVEKIIEVEKIMEVIKPCTKCLEPCIECAAKDEKLAEYEKMKEQLLFNLNYMKESYDVLNRTVTGLQKTNSERESALTMMNVTMMTKQKAINFYIEESAKWKQELEPRRLKMRESNIYYKVILVLIILLIKFIRLLQVSKHSKMTNQKGRYWWKCRRRTEETFLETIKPGVSC
ncbi:hypothetical protein HanHA300_Chr07g0244751 [Helianthus annuus]|nr:hypothetical protein HanHA300_Chr07g0244751 [Helianthus annuus]KAJ0563339.1 hypothetical protein HanHA89_Chr07g0261951 [Helianthus annuus]KAJ0731437.1 hypothetical protein HanOQP8_Chr07g0251921 [Helianthus annuus]